MSHNRSQERMISSNSKHELFTASLADSVTQPTPAQKPARGNRVFQPNRGEPEPLGYRLLCAALATVVIFSSGCASTMKNRLAETAKGLGYEERIVTGKGFDHRVYLNAPATSLATTLEAGDERVRLHVYIDGDGTPWLGPGRVSSDPTPRNPLVLRLMAVDPNPSLYLGRPCYGHGESQSACHPWLWTHGRYSESVVASMVAALREISREMNAAELVLIGYSGGGTLAMLMAPRLESVTVVATLAGNLDVSAWVQHHGYSPLTGSLDPAAEAGLPENIQQWHWLGAEDQTVPPEIVRPMLARQPAAHVSILPRLDHRCCWEEVWRVLLLDLMTQDRGPLDREPVALESDREGPAGSPAHHRAREPAAQPR